MPVDPSAPSSGDQLPGGPLESIDVPRESARTIFFQFVVFPLGVVLIGVLVFLLFGWLASERHSIRDHVNDMRSGSAHQRWQAAYQLSKSLKRGEAKDFPNLQQDIADVYVKAKNDDPKVRRYLTMVLGTLGDRRSTPLLLDALDDPDPETKIYAMLALAQLGDPNGVPKITSLAGDETSDVRKTAAFALGRFGRPESREVLVRMIDDPIADVRWNAALALSRYRDPRALPQLRSILDRKHLGTIPQLREDQKEGAMIVAISAYGKMVGKAAEPQLRILATTDPSLRVRHAAKSALQQMGM